MAFTGDLEHLHIVDIIQLLNTSRKSGTLTVRGERGESSIIFSNGYMVGASHLDNKVRIGTVLVKMNLVTLTDLQQAIEIQQSAGKGRKPLISTLLDMGKLKRDGAAKGLRKLIEITLAELVGWMSGTFTLDTEAISVSPECSYYADKMEQDISLDGQMLLMDALRIFDERQKEIGSGKTVTPDEELYADLIMSKPTTPDGGETAPLTADDLGLGELDKLERKIPRYMPADEIFDPSAIHRQKIKEILSGFPEQEQETFISFLKRYAKDRSDTDRLPKREARPEGIVLLSGDELLSYSLTTVCSTGGAFIFTTGSEKEIDLLIGECLKLDAVTCLVLDVPASESEPLAQERFHGLRRGMRDKYPQVTILHMAPAKFQNFSLASYAEGVRAVFPRPAANGPHGAFVREMISLLEAFKSYMDAFFAQQKTAKRDGADMRVSRLKDLLASVRAAGEPAAVMLLLLQYLSGICARSITFSVRRNELVGEKAIGVFDEKSAGPTSVSTLKIPLSEPSVFRSAVRDMRCFHGECNDRFLSELFERIGEPLIPSIVLLPVVSGGKTTVLLYGDFGMAEAPALNADFLEIPAQAAGLSVETILYRKQFLKTHNP